jgi:large subunit ribosomal protein L21
MTWPPWLRGAVVKGRILHSRLGDKTIIYKMRPKKKTRRKSGHRHNLVGFVVDSIHLNGEKLHK